MKKNIYDNIGETLRKNAKLSGKLGVVIEIIGLILLLLTIFSNGNNVILGFVLIIIGIGLYGTSLWAYAFAQMVDDVHVIRIAQEDSKEKKVIVKTSTVACQEKAAETTQFKEEIPKSGLSAEEYRQAQQEIEEDIKKWTHSISNQ